jgi:peptidoglycan/LPS O-acetylase OafA/YrhL
MNHGAAAADRAAPADAHEANNFDALRLLFAFAVVLFHIAVLTAIPALAPARPALAQAAELGVQGFFVISGYLVYGSYERTRSVRRYFEKRARRLYPAYAAIVLLMALTALIYFTRSPEALAHVGRYLAANLAFANFLEPTLPSMFPGHPSEAVNGALWTIKIEVGFYLAVPILAFLLNRLPKLPLVLAVYAGAIAWQAGFAMLDARTGWPYAADLARQLPGQMGFFIAGVALWIWRDKARHLAGVVGAAAAVLFAASLATPFVPAPFAPMLETMLRPAGWAGLVFWAAYGIPRLYDAKAHGDYSYGLYLVHFPIIQLVVMAGIAAAAPGKAIALILALCALAAWSMWRFVELPFLLPSSHYKRPEDEEL